MNCAEAKEIMKSHSKLLREMKQKGLKVEDMPADVAESFLFLHQRATLAYMVIRKARKEGR